MFLLYTSLVLLLMCGIGLLIIPFITSPSSLGKYFFILVIFLSGFSLTLYIKSNNHTALKQWLTHGKQHYQLQQQIDHLGGFSGMIQRIKQKLATNPNDAEGWFILGKLYLANGEYLAAQQALNKAQALRPNDLQIRRYYEKAIEKNS